jgi:hypothetical protein
LRRRSRAAKLAPVNGSTFRFKDAVEWLLVAAVVFLILHLFLANNGFIGHSDIQPYPY